jgi:hypothetical protein
MLSALLIAKKRVNKVVTAAAAVLLSTGVGNLASQSDYIEFHVGQVPAFKLSLNLLTRKRVFKNGILKVFKRNENDIAEAEDSLDKIHEKLKYSDIEYRKYGDKKNGEKFLVYSRAEKLLLGEVMTFKKLFWYLWNNFCKIENEINQLMTNFSHGFLAQDKMTKEQIDRLIEMNQLEDIESGLGLGLLKYLRQSILDHLPADKTNWDDETERSRLLSFKSYVYDDIDLDAFISKWNINQQMDGVIKKQLSIPRTLKDCRKAAGTGLCCILGTTYCVLEGTVSCLSNFYAGTLGPDGCCNAP